MAATAEPPVSEPSRRPDDRGDAKVRHRPVPPPAERSPSPGGWPLPPDLRVGPVVVGVDDAAACGRPLRAAVFLARSLGRELVAVHVRRRALPMVEGYLPVPDEIQADDDAEKAVEQGLVADLTSSGELDGLTWRLVSAAGDTATELLRLAEEYDAACLVVGKRHSGFAEFWHRLSAGSVSRAVVASQKFPVMVVP